MKGFLLGATFLLAAACSRAEEQAVVAIPAEAEPSALVSVPEGTWRPFYPGKDEPEAYEVAPFQLEAHAVTNRQYLAFVKANPSWRRSQVPSLFADSQYLAHWPDDLHHPAEAAEAPVTNVSWFAARAYAEWIGRRLPTIAEWELAAAGSGPQAASEILAWYSSPSPATPLPVGSGMKNEFGANDMHGLIWEWVDNFNDALITGESRADAGLERDLFCGSGSVGAADPSDYASFMRYAFRSSLKAAFCVKNLGFRCALDGSGEELPPCCAAEAELAAGPLPEDSLWQVSASWQDQEGRAFALNALRGTVVITTMMFSTCQYACPRTLADLQAIHEQLSPDQRARVQWLLVSFDALHDTPEVLKAFAQEHGLAASRWTLLHGDAASVRTWAAALGVRYKPILEGGFAHSNLITVLDREGRVAARFEGLGVDAVAAAIKITQIVEQD
jgi:formylglycine-generating enzyme required for sulfatase activity